MESIFFSLCLRLQLIDACLCRTSGNLCLSFSMTTCTDASSNRSIETPEVTIFSKKTHRNHNHKSTILGAVGGAFIIALLFISISVFLYTRKERNEATYTESMSTDELIISTMKVHDFVLILTFYSL